ncbi:hypothetical protein [Caballeronia sp. LZ032]|uniref:hypothetical protein n=1 Tax=Caballeronia sp. LZ032 TaxID=3038565 RepID=UPI00286472AA|nr:hypothetical protein [Caballeronia sp. LZ032]MDR5881205.1 hypothetical protein [Caballeronia sp. LZ032]
MNLTGRVPTLVDGDSVFREPDAIVSTAELGQLLRYRKCGDLPSGLGKQQGVLDEWRVAVRLAGCDLVVKLQQVACRLVNSCHSYDIADEEVSAMPVVVVPSARQDVIAMSGA